MASNEMTEPGGAGAPEAVDPRELAAALGHDFAEPALLREATTHPSVMGLDRGANRGRGGEVACGYERLEFLGDRVLGLVIAEWLVEQYPREKEGALAKRHASLVQREALARVARTVGLGRYLVLSPAEDAGGGRANPTILADACEAVIGALYRDGGLEPVRRFIRQHWGAWLERPVPPPMDPKTALQEWAQGRGRPLPAYELVEQSGSAHAPLFRVRVQVAGSDPVVGSGPSKRAAEKDAARLLLRQVGVMVDD